MTKELEPCPFCGGRLVVFHDGFGYSYRHADPTKALIKHCPIVVTRCQSEDTMIRFLNTRYKRTCKSSYCKETDEWQCHECGGTLQTCAMFDPDVDGFVSSPKFCPNCGAEVVDGD